MKKHKVVVHCSELGWGTSTWVNTFSTEKEAKDWIAEMEANYCEREKGSRGTPNIYYTYTYVPLEK